MSESRTAARRSARSAAVDDAFGARIDALTFLGASFVLALVTDLAGSPRSTLQGWLLGDGDRRQRLTVTPLASSADGRSTVVLLGSGRRPLSAPGTEQIALETARGTTVAMVTVVQANIAPEDFGTRLRGQLDAAERVRLQERILARVARAGTLADTGGALAALHGAARERLPAPSGGPAATCVAHVDGFWRVDHSSYYVEGWAFDRVSQLRSLRLVTPQGRRVELLGEAFRYSRPDVCTHFGVPATERLGFIAFVELSEACASDAGWLLQGELSDGGGFEVDVPALVDQPLTVRTTILNDLDLDDGDGRLLSGHVAPALTRLQRRLSASVAIDTVDQHGTPPEQPEVTIVVPLYRRTEFLEHQLAQFVHDPEIHAADLVYVLDSPEEAARLRRFARHLHELYGVPFRLAVLSENGGYSAANNLGASLARGRKLLLLNSDVLPARPGWLSRLVEAYDANPRIGALAPKLLYEDDSIQHAGMHFERNLECDGEAGWWNEHFYKGLHRRFEPANVSRPVPAVTGACLLIDLELFRELGGLRGIYVRGDYEDSDLCLRLREQGRESWYAADVELYHLEGQSYPTPERAAASRYNQWLHSDVWRAALTELEDVA